MDFLTLRMIEDQRMQKLWEVWELDRVLDKVFQLLLWSGWRNIAGILKWFLYSVAGLMTIYSFNEHS